MRVKDRLVEDEDIQHITGVNVVESWFTLKVCPPIGKSINTQGPSRSQRVRNISQKNGSDDSDMIPVDSSATLKLPRLPHLLLCT